MADLKHPLSEVAGLLNQSPAVTSLPLAAAGDLGWPLVAVPKGDRLDKHPKLAVDESLLAAPLDAPWSCGCIVGAAF